MKDKDKELKDNHLLDQSKENDNISKSEEVLEGNVSVEDYNDSIIDENALQEEPSVNFVLLNENGIDVEKTEVSLLKSPKDDGNDDCERFDLTLSDCEDEYYNDRYTTTLLILGAVVALILSYCVIFTSRLSKIEQSMGMIEPAPALYQVQNCCGDTEINILKDILTSKISKEGYSVQLVDAIKYLDYLNECNGYNMSTFEAFVMFSQALDGANISLNLNEYETFMIILNDKINESIFKGQLTEKQARHVVFSLLNAFDGSLDLDRALTVL